MNNADLMKLLSGNGIASQEIVCEGGRILVAAGGARILRLTGVSGHDFLWIHPGLLQGDFDKARGASGWLNLGGDRTWLSPEYQLFIRDLKNMWETYQVPAQFDPGEYRIWKEADKINLASKFKLPNHRLGVEAEVSLEKSVRAIPHPLRDAADAEGLLRAEYVGYEQTTTLALLSSPTAGMRLGLWQLAQVPATGEILIPITDDSAPRLYFGSLEGNRVSVELGLLRFRVDAAGMAKIGVKAASLIGRAGFLKKEDDAWSLLVRNFSVNPSGEYVDTPWDAPADTGYALQCFNDDGNLGQFGELEYHAPAIGEGTGLTICTEQSQLWAFRGEEAVIRKIAERLLGIGI